MAWVRSQPNTMKHLKKHPVAYDADRDGLLLPAAAAWLFLKSWNTLKPVAQKFMPKWSAMVLHQMATTWWHPLVKARSLHATGTCYG